MKFPLLMFSASLLTLSACANMGDGQVPSMSQLLMDATGQKGRACVRKGDIQGYGVLDNNWVSIDGMRDYYLASVLPGCQSLSTSPRALFESRFYEVCGGGSGRLHTDGESCTIQHIFEFDNREEAFAAWRAAEEERERLLEAAEEAERQ